MSKYTFLDGEWKIDILGVITLKLSYSIIFRISYGIFKLYLAHCHFPNKYSIEFPFRIKDLILMRILKYKYISRK